MRGISVAARTLHTVVGTDLVRVGDGRFLVLEDNLRVPSGVSYMLANRQGHETRLPRLFGQLRRAPYRPLRAGVAAALRWLGRAGRTDPSIVLLTPGVFNSAYLAHLPGRQMGIPLVKAEICSSITTWCICGRRPGCAASMSSIAASTTTSSTPWFSGPTRSWRARPVQRIRMGNVALANAVGTGVADDKAIYAYVLH